MRDAVREAVVDRVETAQHTKEGVYDLEANASEMLTETRVTNGPIYRKLCAEHGAGFCHQTAVIGFSGVDFGGEVEKPYDFREVGWIADADPQKDVGFRLAEND